MAIALLWISAFGLGLPCVLAIRNLLSGRDLPLVFGFKAYGGGPFEANGIPTSIPLLVAFLLVCALDGIAGFLLLAGRKIGGVVALATLPLGAVFWWGFDLPYPPIPALVRTYLILRRWSRLL